MKTPEQKAAEYCKKTNGICAECKKVKNCNIEEKIGSCKSKFPYYFAFLAGYESANEWISVDDDLPENETYINLKLKNGDLTSIFYETRSDLIMLKRDCTHWKPIN